jgi:hypothetical protein
MAHMDELNDGLSQEELARAHAVNRRINGFVVTTVCHDCRKEETRVLNPKSWERRKLPFCESCMKVRGLHAC